MSPAFSPCMSFAPSTKDLSDSSVIVFNNSVDTTPGSIHVIRMFERTLSSCLNPSLKAATACFVAQYTLPAGNTILPATDEMLIIWPDFFFLQIRNDGSCAEKYALDVYVNHLLPFINFEIFYKAEWHQACIVY